MTSDDSMRTPIPAEPEQIKDIEGAYKAALDHLAKEAQERANLIAANIRLLNERDDALKRAAEVTEDRRLLAESNTRLMNERDDALKRAKAAEDEVDIWKTVFPDIAPDRVLPDRSAVEAERNAALARAEKAEAERDEAREQNIRLNGDVADAVKARKLWQDRAEAANAGCDRMAAERDAAREEASRLRAALGHLLQSRDRALALGHRVRKKSGSQWQGRIVGWYSTALTPVGWAVESETHRGSVQIYPEGALELVPAEPVEDQSRLRQEQNESLARMQAETAAWYAKRTAKAGAPTGDVCRECGGKEG